MAHNFYFANREIPKIRPLIVDKENVFQILIPWGLQNRTSERAQKMFEVLNMTFDEEATRVKSEDNISETPRGKLLTALQLLNQEIYKENSAELSKAEAYEWLVVIKTKKTWVWAMSGGFYLKCENQESNLNGLIQDQNSRSVDLPLDLVGLEKNCFVSTGSFSREKNGPIFVIKKSRNESVAEFQFSTIKDELYDKESNSSFWIAEVSEIQETRF